MLYETQVGRPTAGYLGTSGQAQMTSYSTGTSPGVPGGSTEPLPPLLSVRHSCLLHTHKKKKKKTRACAYYRGL